MALDLSPGTDAFPPLPFAALEGFDGDDHAAAFACFKRSAQAALAQAPPLRPAVQANTDLQAVFRSAQSMGEPSAEAAKRFFIENFHPVGVGDDGRAFYTGYYEPVVEGSLTRSPDFAAPILARPDDLRTFAADEPRPASLQGLSSARVTPAGGLEPYPVRATIEAAAIEGWLRSIVWLRDWVEVFLIQVQGSARVRLPDGTILRLTYAGRNGHPYTSIGRILVERGAIALDAMALESLKAWLRQAGQEPGEAGRAVMQANASYIFFDANRIDSVEGPIGGEGVPLTPLRSIAVDRTRWSYGLPFWVEVALPPGLPTPARFNRLMVAQDTGSAITGPARVDIYVGSGEEAGRLAGGIRHHGRLVLLRPNPAGGCP